MRISRTWVYRSQIRDVSQWDRNISTGKRLFLAPNTSKNTLSDLMPPDDTLHTTYMAFQPTQITVSDSLPIVLTFTALVLLPYRIRWRSCIRAYVGWNIWTSLCIISLPSPADHTGGPLTSHMHTTWRTNGDGWDEDGKMRKGVTLCSLYVADKDR